MTASPPPHVTLDEARARHKGAETFRFGDNEALCADLTALVRRGVKTATCQAKAVYDAGEEAWPLVGRRDIALNWDGTPALVIETASLEEVPFIEVTEDFALAEGEHDDLAGWRRDHEAYFRRNGGFDPAMILVCERFRMVEDFG